MKKKQVMALMLVMALAAQTAGGSVAASAGAKKTTDSASSESADSENESTSSGTASTDSDVSGSDLENAMESAAGVTADGAAKKEETVYVFTDAKGSQKKITVSNWLKNENGDDTLQDETTLDDVQNVEGDETFKQDGDKLTWDAKGNDIYYQGTTSKQAPVGVQIAYYLDGREVEPSDLAGKSGKVTIKIKYTNSQKDGDVYVPFTAMTGLVFSNDNVRNVKVDNGSVISTGKSTVVVGLGFPGLQDSLQSVKDDTKH